MRGAGREGGGSWPCSYSFSTHTASAITTRSLHSSPTPSGAQRYGVRLYSGRYGLRSPLSQGLYNWCYGGCPARRLLSALWTGWPGVIRSALWTGWPGVIRSALWTGWPGVIGSALWTGWPSVTGSALRTGWPGVTGSALWTGWPGVIGSAPETGWFVL